MRLADETQMRSYMQTDSVLNLLKEIETQDEVFFTSHRWLLETPPKRMIYWEIYGDLFKSGASSRRILDVGGGFCSLSRLLIQNHDYTLLDFMAHDNQTALKDIESKIGIPFWQNTDWAQFEPQQPYDLIISNDLFPNTDQRLALFLEKYLPYCHEMCLSLTFYNTPRYYSVKRLDADEIYNILAWDGWQLKRVLETYAGQIEEPRWDIFEQSLPSLFTNGRQVCLVKLRSG